MTKEFEKIRSILKPFNEEIQTRQSNEEAERKRKEDEEWREFYEGIKRDQEILDNSGVKEIFKEIRDSGLVKASSKPFFEKVPIYKEKLFGGLVLDHYENKKVLDYTPAFIYYSDYSTGGIPKNIRNKREVSISLIFDICEAGSDGIGGGSSEVKIAVKNNQLNLVNYGKVERFEYGYTPIEDGKLGETIAEAIKNPIRW